VHNATAAMATSGRRNPMTFEALIMKMSTRIDHL
jgi:hypothetical protein